jgi:ferritin
VFEQAYATECEYREHLEKIVLLARAEQDELTAIEIAKMLDDQVESCNEFEVLLNKAKAYSALPGLYYHLDTELRKKAKK